MELVQENGYLSLNPYLDDISSVTKIQTAIPQYESYSLRKKISAIKACSQSYKGIIFYRDYILAALFILLHPVMANRKKLVFHEFYLPPLWSQNGKKLPAIIMGCKRMILNVLLKALFHTFDKIIVHSSEEVKYLSKHYCEPASKFEFIPYFSYESTTYNAVCRPMASDPVFCSAGNNRDFHTFARALSLMHCRGLIIGVSKEDLSTEVMLEVYPKVPRDEYDRLVKKSE